MILKSTSIAFKCTLFGFLNLRCRRCKKLDAGNNTVAKWSSNCLKSFILCGPSDLKLVFSLITVSRFSRFSVFNVLENNVFGHLRNWKLEQGGSFVKLINVWQVRYQFYISFKFHVRQVYSLMCQFWNRIITGMVHLVIRISQLEHATRKVYFSSIAL